MPLTMELIEAARKGAVLVSGNWRMEWRDEVLQWCRGRGKSVPAQMNSFILDADWRIEEPPAIAYSYTLRWGENKVLPPTEGRGPVIDAGPYTYALCDWSTHYECLIFEHKRLSVMGDVDSPTRQSASRCCNTETVRCEAAQPMMFWDSVNECWAQGKWHQAQAGEWCLPVAARRRRT